MNLMFGITWILKLSKYLVPRATKNSSKKMPDFRVTREYFAALGFLSHNERNLYIAWNIYKAGCEKFNVKKSQMKRINTDFEIILDVGCTVPSVSFMGFDSNLLL